MPKPRAAITRRYGRSKHAAPRSLAVGLVTGLLAAVVRANEDSEGPVILLGFVFVPVGAGWGALVGSGIIDYHWRTVWERP